MLPAASVARTENVCGPSARPDSASGEAQAAYAPASKLHWNDDPASEEVKAKLGEASLDGFVGCAVIVVVGALLSTMTVVFAELPVLPALSRTRDETS